MSLLHYFWSCIYDNKSLKLSHSSQVKIVQIRETYFRIYRIDLSEKYLDTSLLNNTEKKENLRICIEQFLRDIEFELSISSKLSFLFH